MRYFARRVGDSNAIKLTLTNTCGKVSYPNPAKARKALRHATNCIGFYRCRICRQYHLTSRKRRGDGGTSLA